MYIQTTPNIFGVNDLSNCDVHNSERGFPIFLSTLTKSVYISTQNFGLSKDTNWTHVVLMIVKPIVSIF